MTTFDAPQETAVKRASYCPPGACGNMDHFSTSWFDGLAFIGAAIACPCPLIPATSRRKPRD
jgi:hypothetical protein